MLWLGLGLLHIYSVRVGACCNCSNVANCCSSRPAGACSCKVEISSLDVCYQITSSTSWLMGGTVLQLICDCLIAFIYRVHLCLKLNELSSRLFLSRYLKTASVARRAALPDVGNCRISFRFTSSCCAQMPQFHLALLYVASI